MLFDTTKTKLIDRGQAKYVKDEDSHKYIIHKDDLELFYAECEKAYNTDDFNHFNSLFKDNMIGCDWNSYWNQEEILK
jgi:hypothetical protein